jgi:hypothetical protein
MELSAPIRPEPHAASSSRPLRVRKYACLRMTARSRTRLYARVPRTIGPHDGDRARCPGMLSKIEFGRTPVTLIIAIEPEQGQIL